MLGRKGLKVREVQGVLPQAYFLTKWTRHKVNMNSSVVRWLYFSMSGYSSIMFCTPKWLLNVLTQWLFSTNPRILEYALRFLLLRTMHKQINSNINHMAASAHVQYEANPVFWLATRAGKMGRNWLIFNSIQPDPTSRVQLQLVQSPDSPSATT